MKNLRKVLALVLVVATLFSFVAMASAKNAADYKDYSDVKYKEAVDILTAIGINEGYTDGTFGPKSLIDRDEVAAMVARLRNGGTLDASLYVGADKVFADVKGQWSEGYVTYCAQVGIVAGRNASTFDPDGKVTGVEVMKMLLCTLGYDAEKQGYVGANWQVNVIRDAKKTGLLIADVADPYKAATREEVAQYFVNALKANMVIGYIGEGIAKLTNSTKLTNGVFVPDATKAEVTYCNAVIDLRSTLADSFKGLMFDNDKLDCLGRPGTLWTYTQGAKVVFEKFYPAVATATYTKDFDISKYEDEIDKYTKEYYVHGRGVDQTALLAAVGNGTVVEVYVDHAAGKIIFVAINTYIGKVSYINSYNGEVTLENQNEAVILTMKKPGVELKVGDMVLFHVCTGTNHADAVAIKTSNIHFGDGVDSIHDLTVVKPVTADVEYGHRYADINKCDVTASGKTYQYNNCYTEYYGNQSIDYIIDYNDENNVAKGTKYDLYLDAYGYIMWAERHVDAVEYFYAYVEPGMKATINGLTLGAGATEPGLDATYKANLVNYTGKAVDPASAAETTVDKGLWEQMKLRGYDKEVSSYGEVTDKGVGLLARFTKDKDGNFVYSQQAQYAEAGTKLGKGSWKLGNGVYADADTLFIIRTPDGKYKEVVGYENLDRDYIAQNVKWWFDPYGIYTTNIQFFVDGKNMAKESTDAHGNLIAFASHVFINAKFTSASIHHFLITDKYDHEAFDLNISYIYKNNYDAHKAFVDGKEAVVLTTKSFQVAKNNPDVLKGDVLENWRLYTGVLELIDVSCCPEHKLPLYVFAEEEAFETGDPIHDRYLHKDSAGNIWVCELAPNGGWFNTDNAVKLAKDAKIITIFFVDGEMKVKVETDSIFNTADAGVEIDFGYVLKNAAGEITVVYRLDTAPASASY